MSFKSELLDINSEIDAAGRLSDQLILGQKVNTLKLKGHYEGRTHSPRPRLVQDNLSPVGLSHFNPSSSQQDSDRNSLVSSALPCSPRTPNTPFLSLSQPLTFFPSLPPLSCLKGSAAF